MEENYDIMFVVMVFDKDHPNGALCTNDDETDWPSILSAPEAILLQEKLNQKFPDSKYKVFALKEM
jgi:hypothetical protein